MNAFDNILGRQILTIQRLDSDVDYEYYSPYAIILTIENETAKLIISATNDGNCVEIRMTTEDQIEKDYGLEFSEHILNELKSDDELLSFIGDKIELVKIAEYNVPEITGSDFVIKQGKYVGVELKTEKYKLLFQNNYGGWIDIDDNVADLNNKDRWNWK